MIVELSLGEVDGSRSRSRSHEVQLSLSVVDGSGTDGGGDEGQLGVLVSLPLGTALNLDLSLPPPGHEFEGLGGVDEVLLLVVEEDLGVVDPLGG